MGEATARIGDIPSLPIFFKLGGRRVLLAGATPPAVWKAELLAAAGAEVLVCDPDPSAEMQALAGARPDRIRIERRHWAVADLDHAALALGALEGEAAEIFHHAARAARIPVNVIDVPELCDLQFGTIVDRSPLLVAISTDGAAPVLGQALRTRIEAALPERIGRWVRAAADWRPALQARKLGFGARRRFWEVFAERALDASGRDPDEADRQACLEAALGIESRPRDGVWLVGIGPGDVKHLTLDAVRVLQSADVIVHEAGIGSDVVNLGRREALRMPEASDLPATANLVATQVGLGRSVAWAARGNPLADNLWSRRRAALDEKSTPVTGVVIGISCDQPESRRGAGCDEARPSRPDQ